MLFSVKAVRKVRKDMSKVCSRAQGATEYLVILGAVLLVSIVVVSATSPVTSSQSSVKQQQSQAYWSSQSPLRVLSAKVVDSNLILSVQNAAASTVRLDGVSVRGSDLPLYPYNSGDYYGPSFCTRPNDNYSSTSMSCQVMLSPGETASIAAQGAGVIDCVGKVGIEVEDVKLTYSLSGSSVSNIVQKGEKPIIASCSQRTCEQGWVKVPGNVSLLVNDFCLMKYEAKCSLADGNGTACFADLPNSTPENAPWGNITQAGAKERCAALGSGYHLTRDREWITAAANILSVPANWQFGAVGSGCLFGGHMDCYGAGNNCSYGYNASSDDRLGYWNGTANYSNGVFFCPFTANATGTKGLETRRTLYLSNGEVVWDMAGNVWEWTDGSVFANRTDPSACNLNGAVPSCSSDPQGITGGQMPTNGAITVYAMVDYTNITNFNALNYSRINLSANSGIGQIYLTPGLALNLNGTVGVYNDSIHAFLRGGSYQNGLGTGVWTLYLNDASGRNRALQGFRCAR